MCKTYTKKHPCNHIYGVQTRLCMDREHQIGAELLTPRSCPNFVYKSARLSSGAGAPKKQKVGECQLCKFKASAESDPLTLDPNSAPMNYANMVTMAEAEGSCTAHYKTGKQLIVGNDGLAGAYIVPGVIPGQRETLRYTTCHKTTPYAVTCYDIYAFVKKREALFEAHSAFVTIWFDLKMTPCGTGVITTLHIDMSTIDNSDGVCDIAHTVAVSLAISRGASNVFVVRPSIEEKYHLFGPETTLSGDPTKMSPIPGAWKEDIVNWRRTLNQPSTFNTNEEENKLKDIAAKKKAAFDEAEAKKAGGGNTGESKTGPSTTVNPRAGSATTPTHGHRPGME